MNAMRLLTILLFLACSTSNAASTPPADFISLEVCLRWSDSSCTLKEFVDLAFNPDAKRSWEKTGTDQWTLTLNVFDKVSKKKSKVILAFGRTSSNGKPIAEVGRMIINDGQTFLAKNGQVYSSADEEVSSVMLPSMIVPLIEKVNEKTGRAAQSRAKNQAQSIALEKKAREKKLQAIPGKYYPSVVNGEEIEIIKVSDDSVKANIKAKCPGGVSKEYRDQLLKLSYSNEWNQYQANLSVDGIDTLVKFGHGQMDEIQGIEFEPVAFANRRKSCLVGRYNKRSKAAEEVMAKNELSRQAEQTRQKSESDERISALAGRYENSAEDIGGTFNIAAANGALTVGYEKKGCKFEGKAVPVKYEKYNETVVGSLKEGECELNLTFRSTGLNLNESGSCKPLCSYADGMYGLNGRYVKK